MGYHISTMQAMLLLLLSATLCEATAPELSERPGGIFSINCGHEGMAACTPACTSEEDQPEWCPKPLTDAGCLEGLIRVAVTPTLNLDQDMPDICMAMPRGGMDCGGAGQPCCMQPRLLQPSTLVRPMCFQGLSCMILNPVLSLPYGGAKHLQAVLSYPGSQGLLQAELMGTCRSAPAVHEAEADPAGSPPGNTAQGVNSVLGHCGVGQPRCPQGTYCASNQDHLLGGARCVPMPACGNPYQPCCPPFSNGEPAVLSIVDKKTAVPTCSSPGAVCVWKSTLATFDPSSSSEAFQPLTAPGSASMILQYPDTMCLPNLSRCGEAGQPCCPHSQFARSNDAMYFRLHMCDPGLRCNDTITLFAGPKGSKPVLGVCKGSEHTCGKLGQRCCSYVDQAGWEWRTCDDGQPGVFCGAENTCTRCPSITTEAGMSQSSLAALSLPGVGNAC